MKTLFNISVLLLLLVLTERSWTQPKGGLWHGIEREIHYKPDGGDFVLVNGKRRFNRALYGTHTAFRVEAGDLPEFALYMPGMGGNFKFGLMRGGRSKWLTAADKIKTVYRPGSMMYEIRDSLLGNGFLQVTVLPLADAEGMVVKTSFDNVPADVQLLWSFGGASGKKFNRDGDIGADPESSFYLQPDYCKDNRYKLEGTAFNLSYGSGRVLSEEDRYGNRPAGNETKTFAPEEANAQKQLVGVVSPSSSVHEADAKEQNSPAVLWASSGSSTPMVTGIVQPSGGREFYYLIINPTAQKTAAYGELKGYFDKAEAARKTLADRIKIVTPDAYINTLGGALSVAADAIWEEPSYLHGAVAWRMRLNAWRGPYAADPLGWHDRARRHFSSYASSQVTNPESGPVVADTALHLARQLEKMGTSMFSSGYISRNPGNNKIAHHYDMNLVFVDELLNHFNYTGDTGYVKEMWPLLVRHLAWEKRNFDADGDGLYDAYAAIWASDALQYSGGGVTHSSAYNYRSNLTAAQLARLIGEDPRPYGAEADKILAAMNNTLWMPANGWYAEYKDLLGRQNLHPSAGLWTVYHAIDERAADPFQAWQSLRYIDTHIPHIPVKAKGLPDTDLYVLSTTNWHPYEWSLNNVALAESQHTALAYWQGGKTVEAYKIWRSSLVESMYLGASPGGFQQLTFYDAVRGELYRDFADGIGTASRAVVEGLFGIQPQALKDSLVIQPGWPLSWNFASLQTPDIKFGFKQSGAGDVYTIAPSYQKKLALRLLIRAKTTGVESVTDNGKPVAWKVVADALGDPLLEIVANPQTVYVLKIRWAGTKPDTALLHTAYTKGDELVVQFPNASVLKVYDPQKILLNVQTAGKRLRASVNAESGNHTAFVQLKQGRFTWWEPLNIDVKEALEIAASIAQPKNSLQFYVRNNTSIPVSGRLKVNAGSDAFSIPLTLGASSVSGLITVPADKVIAGSNEVLFSPDNEKVVSVRQNLVTWNLDARPVKAETLDLTDYFNDKVADIFKHQYLSPRPAVPTLQLPTQGIGEWTHPLITATIDDSGLRSAAGARSVFVLPQGIPFATPSDTAKTNVVFTSQWNNFPKQVEIPLTGVASHAYLLMAGSTNPMQSRTTNGVVTVNYADGSSDTLLLKNPETWWPVEQDYYDDGYAFSIDAARPVRIRLKTGTVIGNAETTVSNNKGKMIDGGAATVLDLPLQESKTLKSLTLQTVANDVVIGLMSLTLVRPK